MKAGLILLTALLATPALGDEPARYEGPLLTLIEENEAGFTPAEHTLLVQCEIFSDRTVITRSFGRGILETSEVRETRLGKTISVFIEQASQGPFLREQTAVDIPTSTYEAIQILPDGSGKSLILYSDTQGQKVTNQSRVATLLRNLIHQHCK